MNRLSLVLSLFAFTAFADSLSAQAKKEVPKKEAPIVAPKTGESVTTTLFDGKTLDGWIGYEDLWSVKDGVIVGKNKDPLKYSTYLLTKDKYSDFRLIFAAKLVESEMHSGVAFWGEVSPKADGKVKDPKADRSENTYKGHLVMFPSGYGMYDLFGRNGLPVNGAAAKKVGKQHDWNDVEILAQGNRVRVAINGVAVVDWRDPEPDRIKEGPIGLQTPFEHGASRSAVQGIEDRDLPEERQAANGEVIRSGEPGA